MSGLIASQRTRAGVNDNSTYYVLKGQPIESPTLVAPVSITSSTGSTTGVINIEGNTASGYLGAVSLTTGASSVAPQQLAITAQPTEDGVDVWIGGNGVDAVNRLQINGGSGLSRVFDGVYNPVQPYVFSIPQTIPGGIIPVVGPIGKVSNILTIPVSNGNAGSVSVPSSYKLFQLITDFSFEVVTTGGGDTYKLYLALTPTAGYDPLVNLGFARFGGDGTYNEDLVNEVLTTFASAGNVSNLYLNVQNETVVEGGDINQVVIDYALIAQPATRISLV